MFDYVIQGTKYSKHDRISYSLQIKIFANNYDK